MSDHLRIGDTEREEAAAALGEHYAAGRITHEEHGERLDRIWAARTRADLFPVFRDLPPLPGSGSRPAYPPQPRTAYPPVAAPSPGFRAPVRRRRGWTVPLVIAVLFLVSAVTETPFILFGLVLWVLLAKHHRGPGSRVDPRNDPRRCPPPWQH